MGKFRSKLKGQSKGKRWKKGQSSSSNPDSKKHRDIARTRFFQENLGPSALTSEALKRHDAVSTVSFAPSSVTSQKLEDDIESLGTSFQTMKTFASDWSECSNASFGRLMRVFRSDSAFHKEMLAILAAVTEVIKQNGGTETSTEYYAALMTTLEELSESKMESSITAVLSLLSMGIKSVPKNVLRVQFNNATAKFLQILNEYANTENNTIVKSILVCLATFLRALDLSAWNNPQTMQVFETLLCPYCIHSKPKWRKSAQQSIAAILKASSFQMDEEGIIIPNIQHPGAARVAEFCITTVEETFGSSAQEVKIPRKGKGIAGQTTLLHIFELMKEVIHTFPKQQIKKSCETILKIMTLNYPLVTSCGLQVLHGLFSTQTASVPAKLNAQLITALYDYQPAVMDVQPTLAWLTVMQQAHVHLADVDINLSSAALPKMVGTCTQMWLSEKTEIMYAATRALEMLLKDTIAPVCESENCITIYQDCLIKCFQSIESGLGYQYNKAWPQVLHIITVMFQVAGKSCGPLLLSCLKSLAELRDSYKFSFNAELEHAVGAAIRSMGPQAVLEVISIKKENNVLNLERSWLLPILKENIHNNSTLEYFVNYIIPLTIHCQRYAAQLMESSDSIGSHSYELLYSQLWNLLPSFCNAPIDIAVSFKNIARVLGTAISDRKELRLAIMAALRKLITFAKTSENESDISELSRFGKNYLPILFNVYTTKPSGTDEEGQRLAALDTIKIYLTITKPDLNEELFKTALNRYKTTDSIEPNDKYIKESILDLIKVLCPYQSYENINTLYEELIKPLSDISNPREQKKIYRILEEVCGNDSAIGCKEFVSKNRKVVQKLLLKSLNSLAVSSKGSRLRCLLCIVKAQPHLDHESNFLRSIVPEAILCFKDINERCRVAAVELLFTVGELLLAKNQMPQFVAMVIAGLGGNPTMMSATIIALASLIHNFSGALGQANIKVIMDNIFELMKTSTREIVGSCISFVKVYMTSFPAPMVLSTLPQIVSSLCQMTEDCKRHFRTKVRDVLDRLVRKYGCEAIEPHVPNTDEVMRKRLKNLRKINARKQRNKDAKKNAADENDEDNWENESFVLKAKPKSIEDILAESDSDIDEMEAKSQKSVKSKKEPKTRKSTDTWIQEDSENIVDFTDPSTASKITATRPGVTPISTYNQPKKDKNRGFKTASDGRLIIEDGSDTDDNEKLKKENFTDYSDSDEDNRSAAETLILGSRKRKRAETVSEYSSTSSKKTIYKPGGSGIHRPLQSSATSVCNSVIGSEYKAKKAKGDVKKSGKLDPYAYLPLNRTALNKRKKLKNAGRFKNIVRGAKKGAKKGSKLGIRKRH